MESANRGGGTEVKGSSPLNAVDSSSIEVAIMKGEREKRLETMVSAIPSHLIPFTVLS